MFIKRENGLPIYIWRKDEDDIEESCYQQAVQLSKLPFAFHHIALMPDCHGGYGMPIGGVLMTKNTIVPYAVGMDIGCGMSFISTDISLKEISNELKRELIEEIYNRIPVGMNKHKEKQKSKVLDEINFEWFDSNTKELDNAYYQIGTLGGGNHFIELQEEVNNENSTINVMLHSGSRHLGKAICDYFVKVAKNLNGKYYSNTFKDLWFIPKDSREGEEYWTWMNIAQDYAMENREAMMNTIKEILKEKIGDFESKLNINCHHNYATIENHFGDNVIVHRKGAIRAQSGDLGIIPGSMGSYSYIVKGKGEASAISSCSHGAGRKMSRKEANRNFNSSDVLSELEKENIYLANSRGDISIADESKGAYKDIDDVMENQKDLVEPIMKLKTIAVVKDVVDNRRKRK